MRVLSLGAGVQSTTVALMSACGELDSLDAAIFADTQSEPSAVYRHLDWLERLLPFPVYRVTAGSLRDEIMGAMRGDNRMDARPPFFTSGGGMLRRQCTQDFKIRPIERKLRELAGIQPRGRGPTSPIIEQWFGISIDEASRMRSSRLRWVAHYYPLVGLQMTRMDCLKWCEKRDYPRPPKSACTFCPFHDRRMWQDMKRDDPDSFADAVRVDMAIRPGDKHQWFLHRDLIPLSEVDLSTPEERGQVNLFENECEGVCGV